MRCSSLLGCIKGDIKAAGIKRIFFVSSNSFVSFTCALIVYCKASLTSRLMAHCAISKLLQIACYFDFLSTILLSTIPFIAAKFGSMKLKMPGRSLIFSFNLSMHFCDSAFPSCIVSLSSSDNVCTWRDCCGCSNGETSYRTQYTAMGRNNTLRRSQSRRSLPDTIRNAIPRVLVNPYRSAYSSWSYSAPRATGHSPEWT